MTLMSHLSDVLKLWTTAPTQPQLEMSVIATRIEQLSIFLPLYYSFFFFIDVFYIH